MIAGKRDQQPGPSDRLQPTLYYGNLADLERHGLQCSGGRHRLCARWQAPQRGSFSIGVQRSIGWERFWMLPMSARFPSPVDQINLNSIPYGTTFQRAAQDPTMYPNGVVPAVEAGLPTALSAWRVWLYGRRCRLFSWAYQGYAASIIDPSAASNYNSASQSTGSYRRLDVWAAIPVKALASTDADFEATDQITARLDYRLADSM
jgi:hypothetical protein